MLAKLSKKYNHAVIPSCCEQGCTLKLQGLRNYVILKGEKITSTEKICDCLIFHKKKNPRRSFSGIKKQFHRYKFHNRKIL